MRDTSETLLVAFLGMIGIELIEGWSAVVMAFIASSFIIFRIVMGVKRKKEDHTMKKEKRAEEHKVHLQNEKKTICK